MTFPDAICKYNTRVSYNWCNLLLSNIFHRSRASDEYKFIEERPRDSPTSPFRPSIGYEHLASLAVSDHDNSRPDDSCNLHGNLFVLSWSRYRAIARADCSFI